jgi:hypothetical protein
LNGICDSSLAQLIVFQNTDPKSEDYFRSDRLDQQDPGNGFIRAIAQL